MAKISSYLKSVKPGKFPVILTSVLVALVVAFIIFILTFEISAYRPGLEKAASEATGVDVKFRGKMWLRLLPRTGLVIRDVQMQKNAEDVVLVKRAVVESQLLPLLKGKITMRGITLSEPEFHLRRDKQGRLNFGSDKKAVERKPLRLAKLSVTKGDIIYTDETSGRRTEAKGCDITTRDISASTDNLLKTLSAKGNITCGEVSSKKLRVSDLKAGIGAREGKIEFSPITMKMFSGEGTGSISAESTGDGTVYKVHIAVKQLRFEEMLTAFGRPQPMRGISDLTGNITMKSGNSRDLTRTMQGEIALSGHNLVLESVDLDTVLEKYEKSQNFNLIDIGAFFTAGPIGPLLTKGYDFGSVYKESRGGRTDIRKLVSRWKINNGIAETEDVAFVTARNRVALKGRLDFVHERFENMTVAVLNERACAIYSQRIDGSFRNPRIEKPHILRSLLGPIFSLAKKPVEMLGADTCEIFYYGSLAHPGK